MMKWNVNRVITVDIENKYKYVDSIWNMSYTLRLIRPSSAPEAGYI